MTLYSSGASEFTEAYRVPRLPTGPDKRGQRRYALAGDPECEIFLWLGDSCHPVKALKDLSETGISIYLDIQIPESTPVLIQYVDDRMQVQINGTVAWCASLQESTCPDPVDATFAMGIKLMSPTMMMVALQRKV